MIIFDFDGVLVDPIRELALSTYNLGADSKVSKLDDLPAGYLNLFCFNHQHTVTPASIMALSLWALQTVAAGGSEDTPLSKEELTARRLSLDPKYTAANFFAARQWLIDNHLQNWLELNKPFEKIWEATRKLNSNSYFILTNKNSVAVNLICDHYGLKISNERLFSGGKGKTKQENILELDKIGNSDTNYILIDDAIENLETLTPILPGRIHPVVATWGYGSLEDQITAQKHGYELATELEFVRKYLSE
jgi:phosphoglycolate phosphatase-like HAD superfamily hydrolase